MIEALVVYVMIWETKVHLVPMHATTCHRVLQHRPVGRWPIRDCKPAGWIAIKGDPSRNAGVTISDGEPNANAALNHKP